MAEKKYKGTIHGYGHHTPDGSGDEIELTSYKGDKMRDQSGNIYSERTNKKSGETYWYSSGGGGDKTT